MLRKSVIVIMGLLLVVGSAAAQQAVEERRPATRDGTVKITLAVGAVRVIGWERDTVAITGTLGAGSERLEFSTDERSTRIRVVLRRMAREIEGSELEIRVPRQSHVAVRTAAADIEVSGVNGALDLESVSGGIRASGNPRMVYAESSGGDVLVDVVSKVIRARSVGGSVTVLRGIGFLEVSTVSGNVHVEGQGFWEGEVTSVAGDIHFEGSFEREASNFYFESHSGKIELVLPADIAADFEITTLTGGEVENEFASSELRNFSTRGGGTLIKVKSFKGEVRILKGDR